MKVLMKSIFPEGIKANIDLPTDKKVECCIDNTIPQNLNPVPTDTIRFFVTTEPIDGTYNKIIFENKHAFTYLLTQFPDLLQLPNAVKLVGCGAFVDPDPEIKKKFAVSIVMTSRNVLPGHFIRHEIYNRRKEIWIPFDIYAGTWNRFEGPDTLSMPPWPNRKEKIMVMDCMFHICIEGLKNAWHYSEKIIDCFITKTIPIYWGCTEIGEYFNEEGIIQVNSADDIIDVCNQLTPEVYDRFLLNVNDNYELALKVYKYEDILKDAMLRAIKK